MQDIVTPDKLPDWVPGQILLSSDGLNWPDVGLRTYRYEGQDVIVPALTEFMLVSYQSGVTPMRRRFEGAWKSETLGPGATSLLTRAQRAHWTWDQPLVVTHLYLSPGLLAGIASEMADCHLAEVQLADVLRTEDALLTSVVDTIAAEVRGQGGGGALYVESLARALGAHLVRRYGTVRLPAPRGTPRLSPAERRKVESFIEENLAEPFSLAQMAAVIGIGPDLFARRFRDAYGVPPYRFVTSRRVARANLLLRQGRLALKEVAALCGFADQAHMTRLFARETGKTPGALRKTVQAGD